MTSQHRTIADAPRGEKLHLADVVRELTETHKHREPFTYERSGVSWAEKHVTEVPALITQLEHHEPSSTGDTQGAGGFKSQPAAHLEALDMLIAIDAEASRWIRVLGEDDPADTIACVRLLHGLHARCDAITQRDIEHDIRRWWSLARIITGFDSAAWRPNGLCPNCNRRGTLRVRVVDELAACIECKAHWDHYTIRTLASQIREQNGDIEDAS